MQIWRKRSLVTMALAAAFGAGYIGYDFAQDRQFAQAQEQREQVRQGLAKAEDLSAAFRNVGRVVEPSVVSIEVRKKGLQVHGGQTPFNDEFFRRFFPDRDGDGQPDIPEGFEFDPDAIPEQQGTGSGVIMETVDGKGYILTNNHVVGGAEEMTITLNDGRTFTDAKVVGTDAKTDLAVVEINADRLPAAKWGNSDELQKGDFIVAFGSPFGYVGSMTHGIVSATHRNNVGILGIGGYENFIQVDAPINPGNSGGPLVNLRGEVVGINTAIASRNGGFQGIGFAIPSNMAKSIYGQLREKGKVTRGWLGVSIRDVSEEPEMARSFGYEGKSGVLVFEVLAGTPAVGKLEHGDIVTKVNDKPVNDVHQLRNAIAALPPGAEVKFDVFRDGKPTSVTVKLGEQPEDVMAARRGEMPGERSTPGAASSNLESLGIRANTLNDQLAQRYNLDVTSGAVITQVTPGSPAARVGLRPGNVITEVGNTPVKSSQDLTAALNKADLKKGVRLYVTTPEGKRFVFLKSER